MSQGSQKNSLNRLPTTAETIIGALCSILLMLGGSVILVLLIHHAEKARTMPRAALEVFAVAALLAGLGLYFLLRIVFTPARTPSKRAVRIASTAFSPALLLVILARIVKSLGW
jgi:hypothetical protein